MTEINNAIIICHHPFQNEAVDDRKLYFEEIPSEPPIRRYFSDLMDRKTISQFHFSLNAINVSIIGSPRWALKLLGRLDPG